MNLTMLILVLAGIFLFTVLVILAALKSGKPKKPDQPADLGHAAEEDVEHIFNDDFREELRNRGRLHFEKIISENAMFLQQDLRLTTSQLNDYMKQEITKTLKDEFKKYEESISDAKQLAIESIQKTQATVEEQRQLLTNQLEKQLSAEKSRQLARFERHMADIVNHYVLEAVGDQIDLTDQLEYIIAELDANKEAIIRDITDGA